VTEATQHQSIASAVFSVAGNLTRLTKTASLFPEMASRFSPQRETEHRFLFPIFLQTVLWKTPAPLRVQSCVASCWRCFASRFSHVGFAANATLPLFRIRTIRPVTCSASQLGWVLACWTLRVL
jgi:hypothetical protein